MQDSKGLNIRVERSSNNKWWGEIIHKLERREHQAAQSSEEL